MVSAIVDEFGEPISKGKPLYTPLFNTKMSIHIDIKAIKQSRKIQRIKQ